MSNKPRKFKIYNKKIKRSQKNSKEYKRKTMSRL